MMLESIEVVMAAHIPKERNNRLWAVAFDWEPRSNPPPFLEDVFVQVPHNAKACLLLLESQIVTGLDPRICEHPLEW